MAITFTVNGAERTLDVDERMPLLWALRDVLSLTGTKYGCGMNRCGACTVHVDGEARRSCVTRVGQVAGKEVVTIEGLSPDGGHALQRAWIEHNVPQCGYCQAGQIMSAAALLQEKPQPTDDDIDSALRVNLCRCGTYQRVRLAIHSAADELRRGGVSSAAGGGER
ncbi:MAG TPA: (2Fe-2S)-binding protein [Thermoanaerobaculia bacterium]|nr:(2Fe-2S)-binding protein [Thermoanaerobaculia bacterium]